MKSTIAGFNQEYALSLKKAVPGKGGKEKTIRIDCTDLIILRWLVDFFPSMTKKVIDGKEYAWLTHKKLLEDLPLLNIEKRAAMERMQKLVELEILEYRLVQKGGTFSYFAFGKNYINLVQSTNRGYVGQPTEGMSVNQQRVCRSTNRGYVGQQTDKDSSIKDKSIKDSIKYIVEYLNKKAGTKFRPTTDATQKHIRARLVDDGYTIEDFCEVIDKKCAQWKGTAQEIYLRPDTLFRPANFESYLNEKVTPQANQRQGATGVAMGPNGIAYDPSMNDLDGAF